MKRSSASAKRDTVSLNDLGTTRSLTARVGIVTGGAAGIGRATACRFAADGARLANLKRVR
jgi:hypothetical protein